MQPPYAARRVIQGPLQGRKVESTTRQVVAEVVEQLAADRRHRTAGEREGSGGEDLRPVLLVVGHLRGLAGAEQVRDLGQDLRPLRRARRHLVDLVAAAEELRSV